MSDYRFLNDLSRKPDEQQMKVCCSLKNTVVAAGAGSGKTQTLATRFAWLVISENIKATEILTLTFTKKAVAEMYERIHQTLAFFAKDFSENITEEQRNRARQALDDFSEVHIQTLDSYCGNIVRQAAVRYGIRPDYSTGGDSSSINESALKFALKYRNNKAVKHFSEVGKIEDFAQNVLAKSVLQYTSIADGDTYFTDFIPKQKEILAKKWNDLLDKFIKNFNQYEQNVKLFNEDSELKNLYVNTKIIRNLTEENIGSKESDFISSVNSNSTMLIKLKTLITSTKTKNGFKDAKADLLVLIESLSLIINYVKDFDYYEELMSLLNVFLKQINREKRISGQLSFKDVSDLALKILKENKDIRQQEKKSYKKIMIDEFQDNNLDNKNLLYLISEKEELQNDDIPLVKDLMVDKLFFVGDEKQSIYKFRGADVSTFKGLKNEFGEENFMEMLTNYRSNNELITCFNLLFGNLYDEKTDDSQGLFLTEQQIDSDVDYEAQYLKKAVGFDRKTKTSLPDSVLNNENIPIHVKYFNKPEEQNDITNNLDVFLTPKEQQSYYIAKTIRDLFDSAEKGSLCYSDFAILDKSRTNRYELIKWLKFFNIPYILDQQIDLFGDGIINDFYAFLRLCVYQSDEHAFAALLCSPLIGLSEQGMEVVLSVLMNKNTADEFILSPFNAEDEDAIKIELDKINEYEFIKYKKGADFFNKEKEETLCRPLTQTLNLLWYEKGYLYETLLDKNLYPLGEQYDFLFELARQNDEQSKSIGFFIDELDKQKYKSFSGNDSEINTKDVTYPLEKDDSIQIMTIHKSKGLQFKHVFLMGCIGLTAKSETRGSSVYYNKDYGFFVSSETAKKSYFSEMNKLEFNKKEIAEIRRIIYVGITRAIEDVYIIGTPLSTTPKNMLLLESQINKYYQDDEILSVDDKTYYTEGAPFDLQSAKNITRGEANSVVNKYRQKSEDSDLLKQKVIDFISPIYADSDFIKKEDNPDLLNDYKRSPSNIKTKDNFDEEKVIFNGDDDNTVLKDNNFSSANFGSLVHMMLEYNLKGIPFDFMSIKDNSFKNLSEKEKAEVLEDAKNTCDSFINSTYAQEFKKAKENKNIAECEYKFRMKDNEYLVTGSIDVLYENEDKTITIIDYKTNKSINPSDYYEQQSYYRKAVALIFFNGDVSKVKTVLFYLRFGKDIDISDFTKTV